MIAPGNEPLMLTLALAFLLSSAYAFGRIHQWHKRGLERDHAYRTGYDNASRSIMSMMTARNSETPTIYRPRRNSRPYHEHDDHEASTSA